MDDKDLAEKADLDEQSRKEIMDIEQKLRIEAAVSF